MTQPLAVNKLYCVQALTQLHCGTGQGVGDIDLPTAKEAATHYPLIPGSSMKGVLRDYFCHNGEKKYFKEGFGPDFTDEDEQYASALMITDARILLLPVRSFAGVFAYTTSPLVLRRFIQDLKQTGKKPPADLPAPDSTGAILVKETENIVNEHLLLEDIELKADSENNEWQKWADFLSDLVFEKEWADEVARKRITLIPDDVFSFLCETALPVTARIKMNKETGTAEKGGLWYEESLPSETILTGVIGATDSHTETKVKGQDILNQFTNEPLTLQLGGKATTGKGLCTLRFTE